MEVAGQTLTPRRGPDGTWSVAVTLIETRGEGGMFLCAPSLGYEAITGSLENPPMVSTEEREVLLGCAWRMDHAEPVVAGAPARLAGPHLRPGDDYNARGDAREILRRHGWELVKGGENEHWRRPGKASGTSATLKGGVFYV
ncbi:MAG: hypothetical protein ACK5TP_00215, partial [bacterium]